MLEPLRVVRPLPLPVNVFVPMLMLPKPPAMLPLTSIPVPVILAWCCVTFDTLILALSNVPELTWFAAMLPWKLLA